MTDGSKTSTGAVDEWAQLPRTCGLCGGQDIPRGVDWPWWIDGKPAHGLCATIVELARITKERRQRLMAQSTLYRLCVFSERMTVVTGGGGRLGPGGADGGFA